MPPAAHTRYLVQPFDCTAQVTVGSTVTGSTATTLGVTVGGRSLGTSTMRYYQCARCSLALPSLPSQDSRADAQCRPQRGWIKEARTRLLTARRRLGVNAARMFMGALQGWKALTGADYGYSLNGTRVSSEASWRAAVAQLRTPEGWVAWLSSAAF